MSGAAETMKGSLELAYQRSNILETGLDRTTLSVLMSLCDRGINPEALVALVKELRPPSSSSSPPHHPHN